MENNVVVIGSLNYDHFIHVPELPAKGQTMQISGIDTACGGKGANQAYQCAKLGMPTFMVGAAGSDVYGTRLLTSLKEAGTDVSFVRTVDVPTGQGYVICAEDGALFSTILHGANWEVTASDVDKILPLIDENTFVVLQMEIPVDIVKYTIRAAFKKNAKIIVNAAPAVPIEKEYFAMCSLVVFNETEAMFYMNKKFAGKDAAVKMIPDFAEELATAVCITLGPEGVIYCDKSGLYTYPAIDVPVVETTGAGDSFIGGLIYAMAEKKDLFSCLKIASYCSAITIQHTGAQESMASLSQLRQFIN
jgi:ribokinase